MKVPEPGTKHRRTQYRTQTKKISVAIRTQTSIVFPNAQMRC